MEKFTYKRSEDYTSGKTEWWTRQLGHLAGQPCKMLELGVLEGRSVEWWLNNIVTHPGSRLECVDRAGHLSEDNRGKITADPEMDVKFDFYERDVIIWLCNRIALGVKSMYDVIYMDSVKHGEDLTLAASLMLRLVKPGGILLFDDYTWKWHEGAKSWFPDPPKISCQEALDGWVKVHSSLLQEVKRENRQLLVVKV